MVSLSKINQPLYIKYMTSILQIICFYLSKLRQVPVLITACFAKQHYIPLIIDNPSENTFHFGGTAAYKRKRVGTKCWMEALVKM